MLRVDFQKSVLNNLFSHTEVMSTQQLLPKHINAGESLSTLVAIYNEDSKLPCDLTIVAAIVYPALLSWTDLIHI